ncbi:MAG: hypothetical protein HY906_02630 [Deltaproteobacteria bacterium]|nr:hypothetical protein [Deltaproteobacteria bacterium]
MEARRPPRLGDANAEPFPFIAGYAESRRVPVRWICFPHEAWAPAPSPFLLDLTSRARQQLLAQVAACGASHLILSEVPAPALRRFLSRERPGLQVRHCASPRSSYSSDWLAAWLGITGEREGFLPDLASPSYRSVPAGGPVPAAPTPVIGSAPCLYAAPLGDNPAYGDVDLSGIERKFACAFCPGPPDLKYRYRTPPLDLAMRQIAAVRAEPETVWSRSQFVIRSAAVFFAMSKLLQRLELEAAAPVSLFFGCRADEVLARADDIAAALAIARRCGHAIHVFSMGVESFSPPENERFNKRLSAATVGAALRRLREWEREYRGTFFFTRHGGLGFILFTPWTTLEDLRLNLAAARELGLEEDGFFLTRRVMLLGDTPLLRLAEHDGLVDPSAAQDRALFEWLQRHCDPGCRRFFEEQDRPWRFREAVTARVCAITVRMAKLDAIVEDDPHHRRIVEAVRSSRVRLLDAFSALLGIAEDHREAPLKVLLEGWLDWLRRAPAGARGDRP